MSLFFDVLKLIHPQTILASMLFPATSVDPSAVSIANHEMEHTQDTEFENFSMHDPNDKHHQVFDIFSSKKRPWSFYLHCYSPLASDHHPSISKYIQQGYTRLPDKALVHFMGNGQRAERLSFLNVLENETQIRIDFAHQEIKNLLNNNVDFRLSYNEMIDYYDAKRKELESKTQDELKEKLRLLSTHDESCKFAYNEFCELPKKWLSRRWILRLCRKFIAIYETNAELNLFENNKSLLTDSFLEALHHNQHQLLDQIISDTVYPQAHMRSIHLDEARMITVDKETKTIQARRIYYANYPGIHTCTKKNNKTVFMSRENIPSILSDYIYYVLTAIKDKHLETIQSQYNRIDLTHDEKERLATIELEGLSIGGFSVQTFLSDQLLKTNRPYFKRENINIDNLHLLRTMHSIYGLLDGFVDNIGAFQTLYRLGKPFLNGADINIRQIHQVIEKSGLHHTTFWDGGTSDNLMNAGKLGDAYRKTYLYNRYTRPSSILLCKDRGPHNECDYKKWLFTRQGENNPLHRAIEDPEYIEENKKNSTTDWSLLFYILFIPALIIVYYLLLQWCFLFNDIRLLVIEKNTHLKENIKLRCSSFWCHAEFIVTVGLGILVNFYRFFFRAAFLPLYIFSSGMVKIQEHKSNGKAALTFFIGLSMSMLFLPISFMPLTIIALSLCLPTACLNKMAGCSFFQTRALYSRTLKNALFLLPKAFRILPSVNQLALYNLMLLVVITSFASLFLKKVFSSFVWPAIRYSFIPTRSPVKTLRSTDRINIAKKINPNHNANLPAPEINIIRSRHLNDETDLSEANSTAIHDCFVCPISKKIMVDPVLASDGYTYDRHSIKSWIKAHEDENKPLVSPSTGATIKTDFLISNHAIDTMLRRYILSNEEIELTSYNRRMMI